MTHFELIDIDHSEILDDVATENEAFQRLSELASQFGWTTFDDLSLVRVDGDSRLLIATDTGLAEMVRHNLPNVKASNIPT